MNYAFSRDIEYVLCLDQDSPQRVEVLRPSQRQLEEAEQQAKEQQAAEEQMISSSESGTGDLHGAEVATHDDKDTNANYENQHIYI